MRHTILAGFAWFDGFSTRLSQRLTPLGGWLILLLFLSGLLGLDVRRADSYRLFAVLAGFLAPALLLSLRFPGRFQAKRHLPLFATVGESLTYQVEITSQTSQSDLILTEKIDAPYPTTEEFHAMREPGETRRNLYDRLVGFHRFLFLCHWKRGARISSFPLPALFADQTGVVTMELLPLRRGEIRFSHLILSRPDPFNLLHARKSLPLPGTLLVLPRRYPLSPPPLARGRKHQAGGVALAGSVGDSEEFVSLRDYRQGDPLRRIHWKSLARTGKPVVREYQEEYFLRHALVLDTFSREGGSVFEEAVSVAASFAMAVETRECLLDLLFVEDRAWCFTAGHGVAEPAHLLTLLACVSPAGDKPFSLLTQTVLSQAQNWSSLLLVLLKWDEPRRHLVEGLLAMSVEFTVYLIVLPGETIDPEPLRQRPDLLKILTVGQVEQGLAAL